MRREGGKSQDCVHHSKHRALQRLAVLQEGCIYPMALTTQGLKELREICIFLIVRSISHDHFFLFFFFTRRSSIHIQLYTCHGDGLWSYGVHVYHVDSE